MAVVVLALAFFALPFVELAVILAVANRVGIAETLLLLLSISVAGAWLTKREGLGVLRAVRARLDAGVMPGRELLDGVLILVAGALLLTPGFVTDAVGLLLLLPPVRAGLRAALRRRFARRLDVRVWRPGQAFPRAQDPDR